MFVCPFIYISSHRGVSLSDCPEFVFGRPFNWTTKTNWEGKKSSRWAWVCQDVPGAAPPWLPVITARRGHVRRLSAPSWWTTVAAEQGKRVGVTVVKTFTWAIYKIPCLLHSQWRINKCWNTSLLQVLCSHIKRLY